MLSLPCGPLTHEEIQTLPRNHTKITHLHKKKIIMPMKVSCLNSTRVDKMVFQKKSFLWYSSFIPSLMVFQKN